MLRPLSDLPARPSTRRHADGGDRRKQVPDVLRLPRPELPAGRCRKRRRRELAAAGRSDGLGPSEQGWESEMICYPALFWHRQRLWLAYNGNGYG